MLKILSVLSLCCCIFITSCATILSGGNQATLRVSSDPSDAKVYLDGMPDGHTPLDLSVDKRKPHTVEVRKDGYQSVSRTVISNLGAGWLIADIFLGGLIGIIVDAATGSWNALDQDHIGFSLEKQ